MAISRGGALVSAQGEGNRPWTMACHQLRKPSSESGAYVYPDLAPEALDAAANERLEVMPDADTTRPGIENVPRPGPEGARDAGQSPGPGHLSPYGPDPTPAQRRRDKHKRRGRYAPAEAGHWYAEQLHILADWQAAWHADAAWFQEDRGGNPPGYPPGPDVPGVPPQSGVAQGNGPGALVGADRDGAALLRDGLPAGRTPGACVAGGLRVPAELPGPGKLTGLG
jgi:hypothetical protein